MCYEANEHCVPAQVVAANKIGMSYFIRDSSAEHTCYEAKRQWQLKCFKRRVRRLRASNLRATIRKIDKGSDPNPGKFTRGSFANWHMRSS